MADATKLIGEWVHLHEEDTADMRVFVRKGAALPPSRGRAKYRIDDALMAHGRGPGADDRPDASAARPVILPDDPDGALPANALRVARVTPDRLYLFK